MFSIKEWNFEEYKAAVKEIEDPVDRLDELKARLGNCWIEWLNYDAEFEDEVFSQGEYENICLRFEIFKTWTEKEIKIHSDKFYNEIALREKSSWFEHVRLPFPVVWNRRTYNDFEPEVRRNGKKKEWIDWLLGNLVEGKEEYWTYEPWILNAFENEEIYEVYMDGRADFNMQSILVGSLTNDFVVFLLNVKQVLALKDASLSNSVELGNAFAFIKTVELEIGGQLIDRHYGDWMNIWCELTHSVSKGEQLEKLVDLTNKRVYIPLQFSFCRNPGLAIPLIALQYHEVKLNMTFADENTVWGNVDTDDHTINQVCLWVDYIYLDTDERRRFAQTSHEYLIEQVQANRDNCTTGVMKVRLNFNHPVKEIMWVHDENKVALGPFHYADLTDKAILQLNGHERFTRRVGDYFSKVQRYQHHTGKSGTNSLTRTYMYSFALQPEEHQPSGTCNFSRIDNAVLELDTADGTCVDIYAVNYNVLRVMSGMGGLAYSN